MLLDIILAQNCPKYTCGDKKGNYCAEFKNKVQKGLEKTDLDVVLHDICEKNQICMIEERLNGKYLSNQNQFFSDHFRDDKLSCGVPERHESYPGESCQKHEDCKQIDTKRICVRNKCHGRIIGAKCDVGECLPGFTCKDSVCTALVKIGQPCKHNSDCVNKAVCYKEICTEKFSIKAGEKIDIPKHTPHPHDRIELFDLCEFGIADDKNNMCVKIIHADLKSPKYIECKIGEECKYKAIGSDRELTKPCECGYNSEGKGYCPLHNSQGNLIFIFR
jgi:hypothetical protein